jgi:plasmid stabilization system protein ParE
MDESSLRDFRTISYRSERQRNLATANRVRRHIYGTIQILRRHPEAGRCGAEAETREFVITKLPYIVTYRPQPDAVEISLCPAWSAGLALDSAPEG